MKDLDLVVLLIKYVFSFDTDRNSFISPLIKISHWTDIVLMKSACQMNCSHLCFISLLINSSSALFFLHLSFVFLFPWKKISSMKDRCNTLIVIRYLFNRSPPIDILLFRCTTKEKDQVSSIHFGRKKANQS